MSQYSEFNIKFPSHNNNTVSLTLREEYGLRVFENRILRRIFEPKSDENRDREGYKEELYSLYRSANKVKIFNFFVPFISAV